LLCMRDLGAPQRESFNTCLRTRLDESQGRVCNLRSARACWSGARSSAARAPSGAASIASISPSTLFPCAAASLYVTLEECPGVPRRCEKRASRSSTASRDGDIRRCVSCSSRRASSCSAWSLKCLLSSSSRSPAGLRRGDAPCGDGTGPRWRPRIEESRLWLKLVDALPCPHSAWRIRLISICACVPPEPGVSHSGTWRRSRASARPWPQILPEPPPRPFHGHS